MVGRIGVALQPLADRLAALLRERTVLHADETPWPSSTPARARRNGLSGGLTAVINWRPARRSWCSITGAARAGRHAQDFLGDWRGHLMVDDFSGYKALFANGVTELGCLAHARRKYFDLNAAEPTRSRGRHWSGLRRCMPSRDCGRELDIEGRTQMVRQEQAKPLLASMHDWLRQSRLTVANGGGTAKAIDYSLKRWAALSRYATDGRLPIDNNPVENAIRPIAIGKKELAFVGSERAGKRAAAMQSLLATAKLNGLDPAAWLRDP